jgi:hypothetical protein
MATPPYLGASQRVATSDDWFAKLGSFVAGSGTPMYFGSGQPSPLAGGILRGTSSPMYAAAPVREPSSQTEPMTSDEEPMCASGSSTCPIDPAALAAGQIAIVIPRERLGPCP